ncbi:YdcF family protein [Kamptonema formosum]|uniref:YdcF family protein n=1 Tax=Kamptonema formosum TaxID=331992 RepID=UPI0003668A34|nr:YdcF family protein [Oscillatoria sp. PCC 10802]
MGPKKGKKQKFSNTSSQQPKTRSHNRKISRIAGSIAAFALLVVTVALFGWLLSNTVALQSAANRPVDAILVLGGSIKREIYVAELAKQYPQTPVLISQGSQDPCIWLIFQRAKAPPQQVLLEKCARNTFDNYYFSLPILSRWQAHRVKVITSPTHLPRAKWLAQIILGSHGIWVEIDLAPETGIPGNRESPLKTGIDVIRSLIWAVISQFVEPASCSALTPLTDVDMQQWRTQGFTCEYQGHLTTH